MNPMDLEAMTGLLFRPEKEDLFRFLRLSIKGGLDLAASALIKLILNRDMVPGPFSGKLFTKLD